ncbi:MAG: arylsulfatase [Verrucomicrobiota bacterium]
MKLLVIAVVFMGWASALPAQTPPGTATRPNFIVILSDDMGYSDLGCYGSEIQTPNLDQLAAGGVRFTQFYNTARCCPTRASLLTGLYPHQAGVGHMIEDKGLEGYQGQLNQKCRTIAEVLRPAHYRTYAVGKWHVSLNLKGDGPKYNWPLQRGFDRYYGTITGAGSYFDPGTLVRDNTPVSALSDPDYRPALFYYTDAITDHAVRFITEHQRDHASEPFFLYVAYTAAHWPLHAKNSDIAKYKGRYDGGYTPIRQARFERAKQLGLIQPTWDLSPQAGDWEAATNQAWEARCMEVYAAMIDSMDQGIGRIVATLRKQGQLENTLVVFLQDNGGCAETIGRNAGPKRPDKPTLPVIPPEAIRLDVRPTQTRAGMPMLRGPENMPGPEDTFIAYGKAWANVSNTPFREYKHWVHEGGISTPLIAHWPRGIATALTNKLVHTPAHLVDIMATCVDLAQADYPAEVAGQKVRPMEGVSLRPLLEDKPLVRPNPLYWEHEGNRAIRIGAWKLVAKGPAGKWELYDMNADRTEMHDLAAEQPERVRELMAQWEAWAKRAQVLPWIWKPPYGQTNAGSSMMDLKAGDSFDQESSPEVAKRPLTITAEVTEPGNGVILAQGGRNLGYALLVVEGRLSFILREKGNLSTVTAATALPSGPCKVGVTLANSGTVTLRVNGKEVAIGNVGGFLSKTPTDGLTVGFDGGHEVGDYKGPNNFQGKLGKISLSLE